MGYTKERDTPIWDNWKCILMCLAIMMADCQYGYDAAILGGFQAMVGFLKIYGYEDPDAPTGWNIATTPQQLISSLFNVGTIAGVLIVPIFGTYFGRRPAIWTGSLVSFVATAIQIGTKNIVGLYWGRILIGVSNGFFTVFANVFAAEIAPAHLRGSLVALFGIWVSVGAILGAVADNYANAYTSRLSYQIPLASLYAIPLVLSILVFFIPESPRWLLIQNRPDEARRALEQVRGNSFGGREELLEEEFQEMKAGIEEELELARHSTYLDMFQGTDLRRSILCYSVVVSHSSSGAWLFISYGTFFFQMAGVQQPFIASILKGVIALVSVAIALFFAQKVLGRRSMMLIAHGASTVFLLAASIAATVAPDTIAGGKAVLAFALLYYGIYNGFSGAISQPLSTELVSSRLRVATLGVAFALDNFFAWLTTFTTPYFINVENLNWGAKYLYIWAGSNLITFVFFWFFLPEVKGRSLEEIDELFQNRVPVRDFPKYECVSSEKAKEIAALVKSGEVNNGEKTGIVRIEEQA